MSKMTLAEAVKIINRHNPGHKMRVNRNELAEWRGELWTKDDVIKIAKSLENPTPKS
jgi:hypothetical protein